MYIISAQDVHESLNFECLINALDAGFTQVAGTPPRQVYLLNDTPENNDAFAVLPAWNEEVIGVKSFTYFPENENYGYKTLSSKVMLFDRQYGQPLALVDGTSVTFWRTACVSALASRYLSRVNSEHLVFFGSGNLASYMIEAHLTVRPIKKVTLIARNREKASSLLSILADRFSHIEFLLGSGDQATVASADIISCATGSHTPLFDGTWVTAGTHIDLVGNHHQQYRECDSFTVSQAKLFVDSKDNVLREAGEVLLPISEGLITTSHIQAQLSNLKAFQFVRSADDITLFKSVGMALSDLLTAHIVYKSVSQEQV